MCTVLAAAATSLNVRSNSRGMVI